MRQEALAIALRLKEAVHMGEVAALISPDRQLTRQVTAALDRWDILPDDSAGLPFTLVQQAAFCAKWASCCQRNSRQGHCSLC